MLEKIAAAVKSRRETLRMSQRVLAAKAEVDPARVADLEAALPGATTVELARLANVLQVEGGALLRGDIVERPRPSVYLRHSSTVAQDFFEEDLAILDHALDDARALRELGALLGAPDPLAFGRTRAPNKDAALDGHRRAQQVRRALHRSSEPIDDPRRVLEETFGVVVVVRRLRTPTPAIAIIVDDAAAVVLNATIAKSRDAVVRVYLAHETGHVLTDPLDGNVHVVREPEDDDSPVRAEQRARGFAAEYLLPRAGLRQLLGPPRGIAGETEARAMIAKARAHFGTPWSITAFHLGNHRYITAELKEELANRAPSGPRAEVTTSLPVPGGPSLLLAERTNLAHESGAITDGEARGLLGIELGQRLPWV